MALLAVTLPSISLVHAQDCARDAMLVFDGSASMAELGLQLDEPKRIDAARSALQDAMPQIAPIRRIGLITYGPGPENSCDGINLKFQPVANAMQPVVDAIALLDPNGLTPLTEAVREASEVLNYRTDPGIVVLVTDGNETCGGSPCALGVELASSAANLTVHVIGFRVDTGRFAGDSPDVELFPDDVSVAKCISDRTGGMYISTETIEELSDALRSTLGCDVIG
ncbi:vWA domain-containing protein [Ruegeria sp. 2205SS24-7]|uniref:vWA domain-containing protein n=1 Tax=Ruegeria discodermiae TaxID=3064389 RepID=UPI0027419458|nr:vWA domain-containing protein [Ruegeria sp. 2205SS24-7]MDP5220368.1 vWA domain-containing protein [Ruegeria sp. 2205SS24-7]